MPVIESDLPIIDTHHHVWRDRGGYMLDDAMTDMSGNWQDAPRTKSRSLISAEQNYWR